MTPLLLGVILHLMPGGDEIPYPIQLLVNYWEMRPAQMGARLDELLRMGVNRITTFVPWQAVESDISHALPRFLQAAFDRKMSVSLIVTPELGVHYPNSGFPKDVITQNDNLARHCDEKPIPVGLPPNAFNLPSLFAPELTKRYYGFLTRIDGMLAALGRSNPGLLEYVNVVLTGSLWKYYRSPHASSRMAFGGAAGDYSSSAALAYRQRLDQFFSQREFVESDPSAASRWKSRTLEGVNRRWFHQHSEDVFRNRSFQLARKKAASVRVREIELFTPEADPALTYTRFLQAIAGGGADFARLSTIIDEAASRAGFASAGPAAPHVYWSRLGGFRGLADSEKQFLILKSLLLMGGRGGGVLLDESEWFSLSQSFRSRAETLARSLAGGDLRLRNRAVYLAPHLWSSAGTLWEEMYRRVGCGARLVSSLELVSSETDSSLIVVDPSFVLTKEAVTRLIAWARVGRVVALPRSALYTGAARAELEKMSGETRRIEIDLGIPYRLHAVGDGKVIVYELPEQGESSTAMFGEMLSSWRTFLTAVLSVAEVQGHCRVSDSRLAVIPMRRRGVRGGFGFFVLNSARRQVTADIIFPGEVFISDLAQSSEPRASRGSLPTNRLPLEVAPCGVVPLAVDGLGNSEIEEKLAAALVAEQTRENVLDATKAELPGFNPNAEAPWS